jgi:hypothetical protein
VSGTTYHYRFVARNTLGLTHGGDRTFVTPRGPRVPILRTGRPARIRPHQAVLRASVNPEGARVSRCEVQWGRNRQYDRVPVRCTPSPGAGHRPVAVTATLTGLGSSRTFHYRFVVRNAVGLVHGPDRTFTTS